MSASKVEQHIQLLNKADLLCVAQAWLHMYCVKLSIHMCRWACFLSLAAADVRRQCYGTLDSPSAGLCCTSCTARGLPSA